MKFFLSVLTSIKGQHVIHKEICEYLPDDSIRIDLGEHYCCDSALEEAKKRYENSNGCFHCSILSYTFY